MDTLDARIKYSIESGEPESWPTYFAIDENTGSVRQLVAVDTSIAKKFQLIIKVIFINLVIFTIFFLILANILIYAC